ncbi:YggL family protein [Oceanicoccus sp. KOV_DT_Chl]|uniref:YggL 50S ribosome-binding family protein n=1 Tax=Oceanicoccus sp. KOV_DT_Chl TaxID=1904639 RepID=UPI000C7D64C1|nr:50S ribosome-binding protein YggL [Oceanicoccus sp. KOV_DT_Chl]
MSNEIIRNKRLRKKLYLEEYAIMGFEFSCKIILDTEADYDQFFDSFADKVEELNLVVSVDGDDNEFEGFVTSAYRYGSATETDRKAIEEILKSYKNITDVNTGELVDVFYGA